MWIKARAYREYEWLNWVYFEVRPYSRIDDILNKAREASGYDGSREVEYKKIAKPPKKWLRKELQSMLQWQKDLGAEISRFEELLG